MEWIEQNNNQPSKAYPYSLYKIRIKLDIKVEQNSYIQKHKKDTGPLLFDVSNRI